MNLSEPSLRTALQRCGRKEPAGLQTIITSVSGYFVSYAQCVLNYQQAQQASRMALSLLWTYASSYEAQQGPASGWIFSIFRHCLAQTIRQNNPTQSKRTLPAAQLATLERWSSQLVHSNWVKQRIPTHSSLSQHDAQLLLAIYFFALDPNQLAQHIGGTGQEWHRRLEKLSAQLVKAQDAWAIPDPLWQAQNLQTCLEALASHTENPVVAQRRQQETAAAQDTLRCEALLAELCEILPPVMLAESTLNQLQTDLGISLPLLHRPSAAQPAKAPQTDQAIGESHTASTPKVSGSVSSTPTSARSSASSPTSSSAPSSAPSSVPSQPSSLPSSSAQNFSNDVTASAKKAAAPRSKTTTNNVAKAIPNSDQPGEGIPPARTSPTSGQKWWKIFALVNLLIILGLLFALWRPTPPPIEVIQMAPRLGAVLQAPGHSATPGWVLSVDPQGQALLTPLVETELNAGERVQLWTQGSKQEELQSLGLIDPNQPVTLTTEHVGTIKEGQIFEMTLESAQQQSTAQPQGPILFMGRVVNFGHYEADDQPHAEP